LHEALALVAGSEEGSISFLKKRNKKLLRQG
jgi:hypothetical protein